MGPQRAVSVRTCSQPNNAEQISGTEWNRSLPVLAAAGARTKAPGAVPVRTGWDSMRKREILHARAKSRFAAILAARRESGIAAPQCQFAFSLHWLALHRKPNRLLWSDQKDRQRSASHTGMNALVPASSSNNPAEKAANKRPDPEIPIAIFS